MWAVPALSAIENQAVASEIPTLIMNGGYDPVTPLAFGQAAAAQLSTRFLYEFPSMGHGSVWENWVDPCPASIAQQFLVEPAIEPDSSCIAAMAPTDFLTTEDIYPTTRSTASTGTSSKTVTRCSSRIAALTVAVLLGTLVYALVYGIAWLIRRRGGAPPGAVLAAGTAAALNLGFAAALAFIMLNTDPLILGFGIRRRAPAVHCSPGRHPGDHRADHRGGSGMDGRRRHTLSPGGALAVGRGLHRLPRVADRPGTSDLLTAGFMHAARGAR